MNRRWLILQVLATAMFVCFSAQAALAALLQMDSSYTQPKVSSGKYPIHSACMMPPQGQLTRIGMKGSEGMPKESEVWANQLKTIVESHLKSDGIAIESATNALSSGASDSEISGVITQIGQKFDAVSPLMIKKPGLIAKSAYTLGDEVGVLPCSEKSDILVFIQGEGQVVTDSRASMSLLVGGPVQVAVIYITMADAKTGEIIGLIRIYPGSNFIHPDEYTFGQSLEDRLTKMNIGTARKNAKAREHCPSVVNCN